MASSGRGKQSFREFTKAANELKRLTMNALKSGEQYTIEEIGEWYDAIIEQYRELIEQDEIPNAELWISRAEDTADEHKAEIEAAYPNTSMARDSDDEDDSGGNFEQDEPADEPDFISGIPVISADECVANGNSARGQIILTYEELIEYLEPIPPSVIQGLVPVFKDGVLIGYRLCAAKDT